MKGGLAALLAALLGRPAQASWFPVEGRPLPPFPVHIVLRLDPALRPYANELSLQKAAEQLGHTLQITDAPAPEGALVLRGEASREIVREGEDGIRVANSNEDGSFWVSLPGIEAMWERQRHRFPDLERQQALINKVTFAIKHEVFVHQIGLAVPSRRAIFRSDDYAAAGYLDSAAPHDSVYDTPTRLRPDHPYILWRLR